MVLIDILGGGGASERFFIFIFFLVIHGLASSLSWAYASYYKFAWIDEGAVSRKAPHIISSWAFLCGGGGGFSSLLYIYTQL